MSFTPDTWHPLPRYGAAVLAHETSDEVLADETARVAKAAELIEEALATFMIAPATAPDEAAEQVTYHFHADAKPGKANGQVSANGYFSAPHVVTGNNAADIVKEARARVAEARKAKRPASVELKKSFAPTVSKINAGSKSMSNPRVGFEEALFTALGALHRLKPAAYDYDLGSNVALVPDLPFDQLGPYLRIVAKLMRISPESWVGTYKSKKFGRPPLYKGNYARAPRSVAAGALGLLAAVGRYASEATDLDEAEARPVLEAMADRPIYLMANGGSSQQTYSHHLVGLALTGALHAAAEALNRVELTSIDGNKFGDKKWDRFKIAAGHFLTLFRPAYARDFFAYRAVYPGAFRDIFRTYFQQVMQIPDEIVAAAEAYGRRLNTAAYIGAVDEIKDDQRRGRQGLSLRDYKNRILTQLESSIGSAKTGPELISRLSTIVGRASGLDFPPEAEPFMRAAVTGADIDVDTAKQLAMAFMRLRSPKQTQDTADEVEAEGADASTAEETTDAAVPDMGFPS